MLCPNLGLRADDSSTHWPIWGPQVHRICRRPALHGAVKPPDIMPTPRFVAAWLCRHPLDSPSQVPAGSKRSDPFLHFSFYLPCVLTTHVLWSPVHDSPVYDSPMCCGPPNIIARHFFYFRDHLFRVSPARTTPMNDPPVLGSPVHDSPVYDSPTLERRHPPAPCVLSLGKIRRACADRAMLLRHPIRADPWAETLKLAPVFFRCTSPWWGTRWRYWTG